MSFLRVVFSRPCTKRLSGGEARNRPTVGPETHPTALAPSAAGPHHELVAHNHMRWGDHEKQHNYGLVSSRMHRTTGPYVFNHHFDTGCHDHGHGSLRVYSAVLLIVAFMLVVSTASARIKPETMALLEGMAKNCGTMAGVIEKCKGPEGIVMTKFGFLKAARRRGANDSQVRILKIYFESGDAAVDRLSSDCPNEASLKGMAAMTLRQCTQF